MRGVHAPVLDPVDDRFDDRRGLPGSWTGEHEQRAAFVVDDPALVVVELGCGRTVPDAAYKTVRGLSTRSSSADFDLFRGGAGRLLAFISSAVRVFCGIPHFSDHGWPLRVGPCVLVHWVLRRCLCGRAGKPAAAVSCSAQYAGHGTGQARNRPRCSPRTAPCGVGWALLAGRLGGGRAPRPWLRGGRRPPRRARQSAAAAPIRHRPVWAHVPGAALWSTCSAACFPSQRAEPSPPGDAAPQRSPLGRVVGESGHLVSLGGDPPARTTRHQGTAPPQVARTDPTWRGPPSPRYSATSP